MLVRAKHRRGGSAAGAQPARMGAGWERRTPSYGAHGGSHRTGRVPQCGSFRAALLLHRRPPRALCVAVIAIRLLAGQRGDVRVEKKALFVLTADVHADLPVVFECQVASPPPASPRQAPLQPRLAVQARVLALGQANGPPPPPPLVAAATAWPNRWRRARSRWRGRVWLGAMHITR